MICRPPGSTSSAPAGRACPESPTGTPDVHLPLREPHLPEALEAHFPTARLQHFVIVKDIPIDEQGLILNKPKRIA